jgi:hypothetical protein
MPEGAASFSSRPRRCPHRAESAPGPVPLRQEGICRQRLFCNQFKGKRPWKRNCIIYPDHAIIRNSVGVYDTKIIGDLIAVCFPVPGYVVAQEGQHCDPEYDHVVEGVDCQHIFYDGLFGFEVDGAMNIQTVPPTALFDSDGRWCTSKRRARWPRPQAVMR